MDQLGTVYDDKMKQESRPSVPSLSMYRFHDEFGHGIGSDGDTVGVTERLDVKDTVTEIDDVREIVGDREGVGVGVCDGVG